MRAQRHDHLAYQKRLRVHHIEESDGETIEARELVHMAEDSDDKDEAQALPMASESVTALAGFVKPLVRTLGSALSLVEIPNVKN